MSTGYGKGTASGLDTPRGEDWRTSAACRDQDPELFFSVGSGPAALAQEAEAKRVCARCSVRSACLAFARDQKIADGVYGGLTADERSYISRSRRRWQGEMAALS